VAQRGTDWVNVFLPLALIAGLVFLLGTAGRDAAGERAMQTPLEPWLELGVGWLAFAAEGAAAAVIGLAVARAVLELGRGLAGSARSPEEIRLSLGRMLALALELTIASDILRTAVAPTRADIVNLGAVVLLRTLLNHFLAAEIREQEERASG
jgi:uncharacterized membrane protein